MMQAGRPSKIIAENITKGFEVTEIWHYNEDIFEEHEFISSFVTDQPNPQKTEDHLKPIISSSICIPEVRPFSKADAQKLLTRRKKGISKTLTNSPVKNSLKDETRQRDFIKKRK